jgi:hypothetical protein
VTKQRRVGVLNTHEAPAVLLLAGLFRSGSHGAKMVRSTAKSDPGAALDGGTNGDC